MNLIGLGFQSVKYISTQCAESINIKEILT